MPLIDSPFIQEIPECKKTMRKLRKKIYKYNINKNASRRNATDASDVLNLLKLRNIPPFLIDSLRRRRAQEISMGAIKNINVSSGCSLTDISSLANQQEKQIKGLFEKHKKREYTTGCITRKTSSSPSLAKQAYFLISNSSSKIMNPEELSSGSEDSQSPMGDHIYSERSSNMRSEGKEMEMELLEPSCSIGDFGMSQGGFEPLSHSHSYLRGNPGMDEFPLNMHQTYGNLFNF